MNNRVLLINKVYSSVFNNLPIGKFMHNEKIIQLQVKGRELRPEREWYRYFLYLLLVLSSEICEKCKGFFKQNLTWNGFCFECCSDYFVFQNVHRGFGSTLKLWICIARSQVFSRSMKISCQLFIFFTFKCL